MRPIPSHIAAVNLDAPLAYVWNDADPTDAYKYEVPRLQKQISEMAPRSIVLFTAGLGQWIAFRLAPHTDDATLFDAIDCARACVVDVAYTDFEKRLPNKVVSGKELRRGPVRGPIVGAARLIGEAIDQLRRREAIAYKAAFVNNLARLVLADQKPFLKWRTWAIDRLVDLDPETDDDSDGRPLPIEALDPESGFEPKDAPKLLRELLKDLDPKKNAFLRTAAEMKKSGFGKPYLL